MNPDLLLAEFDDLLRSMPAMDNLRLLSPEILEWRGRVAAVVEHWQILKSVPLSRSLRLIDTGDPRQVEHGVRNLIELLQEGRHSLRLASPTATSMLVGPGAVFEYFDEVRKIITTAKNELFFVDPYADPDFVAKFLPQIGPTIAIRILTKQNVSALLPSVDVFVKQFGHNIEVRSSPSIHDRYVFLDKRECFQSGASFKDGAKKAPVGIVQIIDAFSAVQSTYEGIWKSGKIERHP
jgi:hypothetical protein